MPSRFRIVLFSLFIFLAGACVATEQQNPVIPPPPQEPTPDPIPEEEIVPIEVEESLPSHTPADFLGMEPVDVQTLLGPVSLKRWEGEAQVMQFANGQCVMDIYFYEATPGGAFEASYLNARTLNGADVDTASCLTSLLPE